MKKLYIRIRPYDVIKTLIYSLLAIFLICTVSSTLPAMGYRGAVPDLVFCATIALSYFEGERVAAVFGTAAGFALEAVGSVGFSILPLFYMLSGALCALLFCRALQKNFGAFMLYCSLFMLIRSAVSVIYIQFSMPDYSLASAVGHVLLGEYVLTLVSAIPVFFITAGLSKLLAGGKGDDADVKM